MIEARVQGVRARAARGGRDRPDRDRACPSHEGDADRVSGSVARSASSTTAWATAARSRRRSSASAREPRSPPTTTRSRAADGLVVPGVGAFPRGDAAPARAGPRRAAARARGRGRAGARAAAWGCSCCSSAPPSTAAPTGLGLLPGAVVQLDARGLKLPHIGWNDVRWRAPSPLIDGPAGPARPSTTCTPTSRVPADEERRARRRASTARRSSSVVGARHVFGAQFHPEKSSAHGLRAARNFAALCATGTPRSVILYPAIDILERPGRAPASRATSTTRPSTTTTRSRPRAPGSRRARASCTSSTSTARATGAPQNLEHLERDHARARRARSSSAAACARCRPCATRCAPAPSA